MTTPMTTQSTIGQADRIGYNAPGNLTEHLNGLELDLDDFERRLVLFLEALKPVLSEPNPEPVAEAAPFSADSRHTIDVCRMRQRLDAIGVLVTNTHARLRV